MTVLHCIVIVYVHVSYEIFTHEHSRKIFVYVFCERLFITEMKKQHGN